MAARLATIWALVRREFRALPSTARGASRSLRRAPGFVAIATLSLGAALGLSTSVFALIDSLRHPESPYHSADQLYSITLRVLRSGPGGAAPSRTDIADALASLRGITARSSARYDFQPIEFPDGGERRGILYTRPGFFEVLGARPRLLGRVWSANDAAHGDVAVVTSCPPRRRWAANRVRVDGATLSIGDNHYKVIGVMPPRTEFSATSGQDIWIPDPTPDTTELGNSTVTARGWRGRHTRSSSAS